MTRRLPLLACLLAVLFSLAPMLAPAAALAAPNDGPAQASPAGITLAGVLTGSPVTVAGPDGTTVSGVTVRSGISDFFTVVCRQWDTSTNAGSLQGDWYYSEPGAASEANIAGQVAGLARSAPMVGHACAVTKDPSPANIARLAFDVVTVIVFVQLVMHAAPEISGLAIAMNHAPGALAAAQVLAQHGPGIIATVRGGMAVIDRLNAEGDQLQARLQAGRQKEIQTPQDLQAFAAPAADALGQLPGLEAAPAAADQALQSETVRTLLPEALAGGRAAVEAGTRWAGQNGPAVREKLADGFAQAGQAAAAAASRAEEALSGLCVNLPFVQVGCSAARVADAR